VVVAVLVAVFDGEDVAVFVAVLVAVFVAVTVAVVVAVPGIDVGVAVLTTGLVVLESHPTIKAAGSEISRNNKPMIFFIFASPLKYFRIPNNS
jgi:hypothetical protein